MLLKVFKAQSPVKNNQYSNFINDHFQRYVCKKKNTKGKNYQRHPYKNTLTKKFPN